MAADDREKIPAEYKRLAQLLENACQQKDDAEIIKYGRLYGEFISVNYAALNLTETDVARFKKHMAECEKSIVEEKISAKKAEEAKRKAEEALEKYHQALLEQPPDGNKRTAH